MKPPTVCDICLLKSSLLSTKVTSCIFQEYIMKILIWLKLVLQSLRFCLISWFSSCFISFSEWVVLVNSLSSLWWSDCKVLIWASKLDDCNCKVQFSTCRQVFSLYSTNISSWTLFNWFVQAASLSFYPIAATRSLASLLDRLSRSACRALTRSSVLFLASVIYFNLSAAAMVPFFTSFLVSCLILAGLFLLQQANQSSLLSEKTVSLQQLFASLVFLQYL